MTEFSDLFPNYYSTKTEICLLFLDLFPLKLWNISIFPNKLDISPAKQLELFPVLCRKYSRLYLWKNLRPICILSCPTIFGKIFEILFTVYEYRLFMLTMLKFRYKYPVSYSLNLNQWNSHWLYQWKYINWWISALIWFHWEISERATWT